MRSLRADRPETLVQDDIGVGKLGFSVRNVRSAGQLLLSAYNFWATMASTSSIYRFWAVPSLKFLATENMPRITVKLRIVDYSEQCISVAVSRIATKFAHKFDVGQRTTYFLKFFYPTPKNTAREKTQIYLKLSRTAVSRKRVTSKRLNISTNK